MQKELEALVESTAKMQCEYYHTFSWENAPEHIKLGCIQEARVILNLYFSQKWLYVEVEEVCKECGGTHTKILFKDNVRGWETKIPCPLCDDNGKVRKFIPAAELLKGE